MKKLILTAAFALSACAGSKPEPEKQARYYSVSCKATDGTQVMAVYAAEGFTSDEVLRDTRDRLKSPAVCTVKQ